LSSTAPGGALRRQLIGFVLVGLAGTAAYLGVYALLRIVLPADIANLAARIAVAFPTTWVNGRHTFQSRVPVLRLYAGALVTVAAGIVITSLPLAAEQALLGVHEHQAELLTLAGATTIATVARFLLMRTWLFRPHPHPHVHDRPSAPPRRAHPPAVQPAGS
jgi:putative flippase GtrA